MLEDNGENKNLDSAKKEIAAEKPSENSTLDALATPVGRDNEAPDASDTVEAIVEEHAVEVDSEQYSETSNESFTKEVAANADGITDEGVEETVNEVVATEKSGVEETAIEAETATDEVAETEEVEDAIQAAEPET